MSLIKCKSCGHEISDIAKNVQIADVVFQIETVSSFV